MPGLTGHRIPRLRSAEASAPNLDPTILLKLLLAYIAVACEAMAQDAQCVPDRSAMVETIRAYARSDASVLGPQGISGSVLEAVGQTERHRFIPGRSCSVAYMD